MKTSITSIFLLSLALACSSGLQAQLLKKLGKRAERAAQRTIERRVDQEASKKTDEVLDSILEPGKKGKQMPETPNPSEDDSDSGTVSSGNSSTKKVASGSTQPLKVYSKFDFVPGDEMLFFDDFTSDFMGDFPAKWNTNGGGEVVTIDGSPNSIPSIG
ncbi:MAG: OmpA family protein, partial [Bacteroidota bacterium]